MLAITAMITATINLSNQPIANLDSTKLTQGSSSHEDPRTLLLSDAQSTNPLRRPFAAANLIISTLILIGSFMLSWRRAFALWWLKQAVLAKVLWILADTTNVVYHLRITFPNLQQSDVQQKVTLGSAANFAILIAVISIGLHVVAVWRASRPDIRAFIERSNQS